MYFPSAYFRAKARAALKGRWQTALLIALIVSLPSLLVQGVTTFAKLDPMSRIYQLFRLSIQNDMLNETFLVQSLEDYLTSSDFFLAAGLNVLAWLITPCLTLGMYRWMLNRLRGTADEPVTTVFCRVRLFFKALGLHLLIVLKVLLWMLPGIGLSAAAYIPVIQAKGNPDGLASAVALSNGLMLPGILLMAIPGIMAALRYAMAEFILADEPEAGILECVRRSKQHMQDMKRMLFTLLLSFMLWYFLGMLAASYLSALGTGTFGLLAQMLLSLVLTVYVSASEGAFFLETAPGKVPRRDRKAEAGTMPGFGPGPDDPEPLN